MATKTINRTAIDFAVVDDLLYYGANGRESSLSMIIDPSTVSADASGRKIVRRGTLMTRITASGDFGPYAAGASDGRQTLAAPTATGLVTAAFLSTDVDVTDGPVAIGGYYGYADFRRSALIVNGATAAAYTAAFPTCFFH